MAETNFLTYKGKPLVRCKDVIYYGDMAEKYVIRMTVLSEDSAKLPDKIKVELLLSDNELSDDKRVSKTSERQGLFEALDIGVAWLDRALNKK